MSSERFDPVDIAKWDILYRDELKCRVGYESKLEIMGCEEQVSHINLPGALFTWLIETRRPDLLKHLPYRVWVKFLERGDNTWLQETAYLGVNNCDELKLYLHPGVEHSALSLLWILLHEFRHKVQASNRCVDSCLDNDNVDRWKLMHGDANLKLVDHVLHEVCPAEVDANVFACEVLGVSYPGSKFDIDDDRINRLRGAMGLKVDDVFPRPHWGSPSVSAGVEGGRCVVNMGAPR